MRSSVYITILLSLVLAGVLFAFSSGGDVQPLDFHNYGVEPDSLWRQLVYRVQVHPFNLIALIIFACAIVHTFVASHFTAWAEALHVRLGEGPRHVSFRVELLRFLGEVEIIFALWCIPLIVAITLWYDWPTAEHYLNSRDYIEPLFVVVIMSLASTRPIMQLTERILSWIASGLGGGVRAWWFTLVTVGPLLGSFITEPGAMTVSALLLCKQVYSRRLSLSLAYATLGLLFVNISVGGVLTNFAAPPVLIVAHRWSWSAEFMFLHFGWKAMVGIVVANCVYLAIFWKELGKLTKNVPIYRIPDMMEGGKQSDAPVPLWITAIHIILVAWIVYVAHDPVVLLGTFLLFLGFHRATAPHQSLLRVRFPLLVGLFLAGLVIHGGLQGWWITPLLERLSQLPLFVISTILTAFNDNASITYLSSLSPNFTPALKYAVTAGAVTGGGLTVIANAPNPAGYQILSKYFPDGISSLRLLLGALLPTVIVGLAFILLGHEFLFGA